MTKHRLRVLYTNACYQIKHSSFPSFSNQDITTGFQRKGAFSILIVLYTV